MLRWPPWVNTGWAPGGAFPACMLLRLAPGSEHPASSMDKPIEAQAAFTRKAVTRSSIPMVRCVIVGRMVAGRALLLEPPLHALPVRRRETILAWGWLPEWMATWTQIDARLVAEAALEGDPLARAVIGRAAEYFALGLFNLLMLFFPEVIVLSGGVMHSSELFMPAIQRMLQSATPYLPTDQVDIRLAQLGYYAGIYGAAYAILNRISHHPFARLKKQAKELINEP